MFSIADVATIWLPCVLFVAGNLLFGNRIGILQRLRNSGAQRPGVRTWVAQQSATSDNTLYFSVLDFWFDGIHYRFDDVNVDDSADTVTFVPSDAEHRWVKVWVDPYDPRIAVSSESRPHHVAVKIIACGAIVFNLIFLIVFSSMVFRFGGHLVTVAFALVIAILGALSANLRGSAWLWRNAKPVITSAPWRYVCEFDETTLREGETRLADQEPANPT